MLILWLCICVLWNVSVDSRIIRKDEVGYQKAVVEEEPSQSAVESMIRTNSKILQKLKKLDSDDNHKVCLELKYLNYSSIQVTTSCIFLFLQPGCAGNPNANANEIIDIKGTNKCQNLPGVEVKTESAIAPPSSTETNVESTTMIIDTVDKIITSTIKTLTTAPSSTTNPTEYDVEFSVEGELGPHLHKIPIATNGDDREVHTNSIPTNLSDSLDSKLKVGNVGPMIIDDDRPVDGNCLRKCSEVDSYGIKWEVCRGGTGFQRCPPDSVGTAEWKCSKNDKFESENPNYSNCNSKWISDAESNILLANPFSRTDGFKTVTRILLDKVQKGRSKPSYFGHEIPGILSLVDRVQGSMGKEDLMDAENIATSSITIIDNVASEPGTWSQLSTRERAMAGTQLLQTTESTVFELAKTGNKFGVPMYEKTFTRPQGLKIRLGSVKSSTEEDSEWIFGGETKKDPHIQLPKHWTQVVQSNQNEPIHYYQLSMGKEYVENILPNEKNQKKLNSQLATFSIANGSVPAKINFKDQGVRIIFPHEGEAYGNGIKEIHRRQHEGENFFVAGSSMCVYWDMELMDWSSDGCSIIQSGRLSTTCECQHLTSFAILMDPYQYVGKDIGIIILTRLLCTLSSIFLLITIILFKKLHTVRNPRSTVTIHLCSSLLIGNILILTLMDRDNFPIPNGFCAFVGMFSHFIFLCAFFWMGIEGYVVYKMVVDVFESGTENKIKLRLLAYGGPFVIVLLFLIVHISTESSVYGGELYCWLQGNYIWSFIVPVLIISFMNTVVLVIALKTAFSKSSLKESLKQAKTMVIGTLSLTCILGLTWVFGIFITIPHVAVGKIGAYLFTILNASQGIFIFIFHVWMNKQVRAAMKRRVTSWQTSNATSNSIENSNKQKKEKLQNDTDSTKVSNNSNHPAEENVAMLPMMAADRAMDTEI